MSVRYHVVRDKFGVSWHVWDNWDTKVVKIVPTRKEARRIVVGLNNGWISRNEVEEAPPGNPAA